MTEAPQPQPKTLRLRRPGLRRFSAVELLVALVLLFVSSPFLEGLKYSHGIETVLMALVMMCAVLAVGGTRRTLIVAVLLVAPAMLARWGNHVRPDLVPAPVFLGAELLFLVFVAVNLLRFILRAPRVNSEVLCAGIAGYLILGLLWILAYMLVARVVPDSFAFSTGPASRQSMGGFTAFYFSFATLTTIGYGDISPVSNVARMLAVTEAVTGLFYMAVLISRLVSLYSSQLPPSDLATPGAPDTHNRPNPP